MLQFRCTQKVIKQLGLTTKDLEGCTPGDTPLGNWYMNLFMLDRRKTFIFMNERTLFSFIVVGIKKSNTDTFPEVFYTGLGQTLITEGFDMGIINKVFAGYREYGYSKTNSKKLLGNMNDLVNMYTHSVIYDGGLQYCDLTRITRQMNRTPQRNIGWGYSSDMVKEILSGQTA